LDVLLCPVSNGGGIRSGWNRTSARVTLSEFNVKWGNLPLLRLDLIKSCTTCQSITSRASPTAGRRKLEAGYCQHQPPAKEKAQW
jgi:hypothetical protein